MRLFSKQEIFLEHFVVFCVFSSDIHDISPLLFPSQVIFASSKKKAIYIPGGGDGTPTVRVPLLCLTTTYYHLYFHIITTTLQKQVPKNNKKQKQIIKNKKQNIRVSQQCLYDYTKRFVLKNLSISSNLYVCIISIC